MKRLKYIVYLFFLVLTLSGNASEIWVEAEIVKFADLKSAIGSKSSKMIADIVSASADEIRGVNEWLSDQEDTIKIEVALTHLIHGDYPKDAHATEYSHALELILEYLGEQNYPFRFFSQNMDWDELDKDYEISHVLRKLGLRNLATFFETLTRSYRLPVPMPAPKEEEDEYLYANYLTQPELLTISQELASLHASSETDLQQKIENLGLSLEDGQPYAEFIWQFQKWVAIAQKRDSEMILFYKYN